MSNLPQKNDIPLPSDALPQGEEFQTLLAARNRVARRWRNLFFAASVIGFVALILLFTNVINQTLGLVAVEYNVKPETLSSQPLDQLSEDELLTILADKVGRRLRIVLRDAELGRTADIQQTVKVLFGSKPYPPELSDVVYAQLTPQQVSQIMGLLYTREQLLAIIEKDVLQPRYVESWPLFYSLQNRPAIEAEIAQKRPDARLQWRSWLNATFVGGDLTSDASTTGLRMALTGSLWIIVLTILISLPLGVGAAVYLEEYAPHTPLSNLIETNIRNLAGVPSIIYGMLGLAVFVRALGDTLGLTSGRVFGSTDTSGRSIISASLTMALLILPVVIINAQEAIRAVPSTLREASFGVGATKWQTVWRVVLPSATPGILTGLILSVSRAVGETAPLIVVGGLTFVTVYPRNIFDKFTVIPIQVYSWTSEPTPQFKNVAAAAIIVLLVLLVSLNATAIIIRNRFARYLRGN
jgi:phosphate transport system permease protein